MIRIQDAATRADVSATADFAAKQLGRLDILVNALDTPAYGPVEASDDTAFDKIMENNLKTVWMSCQEGARVMLRQGGGVIVNITSVMAERGVPNAALYCAAKAAVLNLTRALALEWARKGIRVNAIEAGWLDDESSPANKDDEFSKNLLKYLPYNRLVKPEELGGALLYLCFAGGRLCDGRIDRGGRRPSRPSLITRSASAIGEHVIAAVPRVLANHVLDASRLDVLGDALDAALDFCLIGSVGETRDAAADARVEIALGLMLAAVEKKILEVGRDVVFFFAHFPKSRRIEHLHRHEALVWRGRFFDHHARKIFVQPAMPHLLGGAVEDHEARVRRQHAMHFLERRERVRHMMMHEGAGRAVEACRRERDRLGARVVPRDRRRFLLRPREHRRRQFEPANRHARLMHRDRVIPGTGSDVEIAAVRRGRR